ncbi:hypothetical protein [Oceanobacillus limi]|nr:hypothetical protein [Oceanobacillus limi]
MQEDVRRKLNEASQKLSSNLNQVQNNLTNLLQNNSKNADLQNRLTSLVNQLRNR